MKQIRSLTHFHRNDKNLPFIVATNGLPPREIFADHPEVLAEYDTLVQLIDAEKQHYRDAAAKTAAADRAAFDYQAAVHTALTTGADPSKIKSKAEQYTAEAKAHATFAAQAKSKADHQGHVLGEAIKKVAADLFPSAEESMDAAAEQIAAVTSDLRSAWTAWAGAWAAREYLSGAHYKGGKRAWPGENIPREVEDAFAVIASALGNVDSLKADEAELERWRGTQRQAQFSGPGNAA